MMVKWQVYEAILFYEDHQASLPVRASSKAEAKQMIETLVTKEGTPDTYYNAWVRGGRRIVCEEDE